MVSVGEADSKYIDIHCHGGAGYYFSDYDSSNISKAIGFHKENGSKHLFASLVTASIEDLGDQIKRLVPFCSAGKLAGIHLEGPYLSESRCGAHNPKLLRLPDLDEVKRLIDLGQGYIKIITIAPELTGALDVIRFLAESGVTAAIGHSSGGYEDALQAIDSGAGLVTHFSNGMSKLEDGERNFASALLYESELPLELILDGHHISERDVRTILEAASERIVLITDAISSSGVGDGDYKIGNLEVEVIDSVARLKGSGKLAGSTLTMNQVVENARTFGFSEQQIENAAMQLPGKFIFNQKP